MNNYKMFQDKEIPLRAKILFFYLDSRSNCDNECWPSMSTIAKDLNVSKRTVARAVSDLKKIGIITTEQRFRDSGAKSSLLYRIKRE